MIVYVWNPENIGWIRLILYKSHGVYVMNHLIKLYFSIWTSNV